MDGFEFCQKILQKDINVRVCFMTSGKINTDAGREVHPLKSIGCFIKRPITTDALVKRWNRIRIARRLRLRLIYVSHLICIPSIVALISHPRWLAIPVV